METKEKINKNTTRQIIFSTFLYSSVSIFGPLVFFGLIGIYLDKVFNTSPVILLISVLIAFIFTNIFLFKKIKYFNKKFKEYSNSKK